MPSSITNYAGNTIATFFKGDSEWNSVVKTFEKAIAEFNQALSHFGTGVGFKTLHEIQSSFHTRFPANMLVLQDSLAKTHGNKHSTCPNS